MLRIGNIAHKKQVKNLMQQFKGFIPSPDIRYFILHENYLSGMPALANMQSFFLSAKCNSIYFWKFSWIPEKYQEMTLNL